MLGWNHRGPPSTNVPANAAIPTTSLARNASFPERHRAFSLRGQIGLVSDRRTCRIVGPPPEPDRRENYTSYFSRVLIFTFIYTGFIIPVTDTTVWMPFIFWGIVVSRWCRHRPSERNGPKTLRTVPDFRLLDERRQSAPPALRATHAATHRDMATLLDITERRARSAHRRRPGHNGIPRSRARGSP